VWSGVGLAKVNGARGPGSEVKAGLAFLLLHTLLC
jgi:hypothetical protein